MNGEWRGPGISRREFGLGAAFLAAAGVAAARLPRTNLNLLGSAKLEAVIPERIGPWTFVSNSGLVVPPEDQLSRALYSQLLTRVYASPAGADIMLLIAQSGTQTGILQIHRPEICYAAGGYQLSGLQRHPVKLPSRQLPSVALTASTGDRTEQIVYWTRIGHHFPMSWAQQREAVAIDNLHGIIPDAVLVRVSTLDTDRATGLSAIDGFIETLVGSASAPVREFLLG